MRKQTIGYTHHDCHAEKRLQSEDDNPIQRKMGATNLAKT